MAGAVVFTTVPNRRSRELLQTLVAFQTIFDFLDDLHERHPTAANGRVYMALVDALTPDKPISDYYTGHPWKEDDGYLEALVEASRRRCEALPSFTSVRELLSREAERAHQVLAMNHLAHSDDRSRALRDWVDREFPAQTEWHWFELTAAASGQLAIFALLALAAKPGVDEEEVIATYDACWPTIPLLTTMLDSFVDQPEDTDNGDHRYVTHYRESERAVERLSGLIERAAQALTPLPDGHRHAVILGSMITFYLTKDSARSPALERETRQLIRAGGSLPRTLAPILRIWRTAYMQRGA
jgi:tetraprenyl-beta-curcumene synthase